MLRGRQDGQHGGAIRVGAANASVEHAFAVLPQDLEAATAPCVEHGRRIQLPDSTVKRVASHHPARWHALWATVQPDRGALPPPAPKIWRLAKSTVNRNLYQYNPVSTVIRPAEARVQDLSRQPQRLAQIR